MSTLQLANGIGELEVSCTAADNHEGEGLAAWLS